MAGFRVTYEIWDHESLDIGETDERGFVLPGEWKTDIETALADKDSDYSMTLREAIDLIGCVENSGEWFSEVDENRVDYATGAVEMRSLHPPRNITPASYARLVRVLKAQRLL
jgi:hypothetical protein